MVGAVRSCVWGRVRCAAMVSRGRANRGVSRSPWWIEVGRRWVVAFVVFGLALIGEWEKSGRRPAGPRRLRHGTRHRIDDRGLWRDANALTPRIGWYYDVGWFVVGRRSGVHDKAGWLAIRREEPELVYSVGVGLPVGRVVHGCQMDQETHGRGRR